MDLPPPSNGASQPPLQPLIMAEALPPRRQKSSFLARLFIVLLLLGLLGSLAVNVLLAGVVALAGFGADDAEGRVQERFVGMNRRGREKVAIFSIEGTILSGEGFFKQQIDHARRDAEAGDLKAVVVRVDSPGGTITGSDYMLHQLKKLAADTHLPIVVSMGGIAASGGYYVSMCVGDNTNTIYAEPTTWTGSIGVVIPHYNVAELMEKWGIQDDAIVSHRLKTMGSLARKMTPEERRIFQALVDDGFTRFKDVIKEGRPRFRKDPEALDKLATGQVFTADQALENGLIDKIGFLEDAVERAIHLAGLDKDNVKVVRYRAEPRLSDILFGQSRVEPAFDLAALLDSATPRAYYLCTWFPSMVGPAAGER